MATLVLFGSLLGSYVNLPLIRLPEERVVSREVVEIFGVPFLAPVTVDWPGTILRHQRRRGGDPDFAVVLSADSLRPLGSRRAGDRDRRLCRPSAGDAGSGNGHFGADLVPPVLAALVALALSRRFAPPFAYIGGSLGVLIGADLLNLGLLRGLGAPVASIGGAGTFDGIFLTGVIAVLLASLLTNTR